MKGYNGHVTLYFFEIWKRKRKHVHVAPERVRYMGE